MHIFACCTSARANGCGSSLEPEHTATPNIWTKMTMEAGCRNGTHCCRRRVPRPYTEPIPPNLLAKGVNIVACCTSAQANDWGALVEQNIEALLRGCGARILRKNDYGGRLLQWDALLQETHSIAAEMRSQERVAKPFRVPRMHHNDPGTHRRNAL